MINIADASLLFNHPAMKITFKTKLKKFRNKGEKTGWTYLEVSSEHAHQLNPNCNVSFRVKGTIDDHVINQKAILPMGDGNFILPLSAQIRKAIGKQEGDDVLVKLDLDHQQKELSHDLLSCLQNEPNSLEFFRSLPPSHQTYFSDWIEGAKTAPTKTKRIVRVLEAMSKKMGFAEMMRARKNP